MKIKSIVVLFLFVLLFHGCTSEPESSGPIIDEIKGFPILRDVSQKHSPGVLENSYHIFQGKDKTFRGTYFNRDVPRATTGVIVTEHDDQYTEKWLIHEVQKDFRRKGELHPNAEIKQVDGNTVLHISKNLATLTFRWLSNKHVVQVEFSIPIDDADTISFNVLKAYLKKYPSTLPDAESFDLRSTHTTTQWIRDEVDRLFSMSDMWYQMNYDEEEKQEIAIKNSTQMLFEIKSYRIEYYEPMELNGNLPFKSLLKPQNPSPDYEQRKISMEIRKRKLKELINIYKKWWIDNREKAITLSEAGTGR